jgi:hypothetical protein
MTVMSTAERLWIRLKAVAARNAGKRITTARALWLVNEAIIEERAVDVPADAREYLAQELQRLSEDR